ncbi:MAG: GGDEF domain-containing protein [Poseidonibacter sp.]|uniref:GGDEF domain-containing protein n=1 Tax=Poseidonibacter sp. TaxID=2321188 RepID=UPI00359F0440
MSQLFEIIIKENEKLKLLEDSGKVYNKIFDYLKEDYNIYELKISFRSQNQDRVLFESTKELDLSYQINLTFPQSQNSEVMYLITAKNEENRKEIEHTLFSIKLTLQIFSQSLYNKYLEKSISELSLIDQVTGSYNRTYLDNYAHNLLSLSQREQKKIAFLKIGIDQFKAVIDEFDYAIGDKVLKTLADTLNENVRTSDIVIKIDSDEFLVILLNIVNEDNAIMISEKIINNFSKKEVLVNSQTEQALKKTVCSGISIYPDDASDIDEIIRNADIALYEARNKGRSQTFKYNKEETNTIDFF